MSEMLAISSLMRVLELLLTAIRFGGPVVLTVLKNIPEVSKDIKDVAELVCPNGDGQVELEKIVANLSSGLQKVMELLEKK